ncbi:Flagellin FlgL [Jannaschia faecimaris]|uniref:Flagellin FlgL n=1 Tax=Jannaschia faecimaris TaxID=1244108 RepID=A0A1H3PND7_9RHOB|nr:hypothetical protein [Jannaschia faecimaris]SDZ01969.1 Flagellin FlgL [Jannaschia faecimaris]
MRTDGHLQSFLAPRDFAADTRERIDRLNEELSTERNFDTGRALSSDFSAYSRVSHDLRTFQAREDALSRATTWMDVAQVSLGFVDAVGTRLAEALTSGLTGNDPGPIATLGATGKGALSDVVNALSKAESGRAVFANGDTSGDPPFDLDVMLIETTALAQSATDVASLLQAFDAYFAQGGGVETNAMSNFPGQSMQFPIGQGKALTIQVNAGDVAIREAVKQAALVSALPSTGFSLSPTDRQSLAQELPRRSVAAAAKLAELRGGLGSVEARADLLSEQMSHEETQLKIRRSDAVRADPLEVANRLQNEMSRLETLYAVTARRSRLRLMDYLR